MHLKNTRYPFLFCTGNSAVLCSYTGSAAFQIGGHTICSLFSLPVGVYKDLTPNALRLKQEQFSSVKYVIIDEYSMISPQIVFKIDDRLRKIFNSDLPFGNCSVLMFGDMLQLPPVGDAPLYAESGRSEHFIRGQQVFQLFDKVFFLDESMRQAGDLQFFNIFFLYCYLLRVSGNPCTGRHLELSSVESYRIVILDTFNLRIFSFEGHLSL